MACADCDHGIHPIQPLDSVATCPNEGGCTACAQAVELETQVVRAMENVKSLLRKLSAQRQVVNHAHSPIVHKMPVEIMSKIFTFVTHAGRPAHHSAPLKLGQVCKTWRSIAWSTPSLWTQLAIDVELSCTPLRVQYIGEFLARAKNSGVALSLCLKPEIVQAAHTLDMYRPLFKQIAAFVHLYKTLALGMPAPLIQLLCSEMPTFHRIFDFHVRTTPKQLSNFLTISHTQDRWKSLAALQLEGVTVAQCVKFIQSAPRLRRATFLAMVWEDDMPTPALEVMVHKHLGFLAVRFLVEDPIPAHSPFTYLTLPRLYYLDYSIESHDQLEERDFPHWYQVAIQRNDAFLAFIKRSACPLEYLKVEGVGWDYYFVTSVFLEVPSITHLRLHSRCEIGNKPVANRFLEHLGRTAKEEVGTSGLLLPHLEHLVVYSDRLSAIHIPWAQVPKCFGIAPISQFQKNPKAYRRLMELEVQCQGDQYQKKDPFIDKANLLRMIELRKSGAQIVYWYKSWESKCPIDFFAASMEFHGLKEESHSEDATKSETHREGV